MRYGVNVLPACVVLSHLAGITLAFPVLDGCPNDSPSLVKRDAEAHVSIPHVVANFDPQSAESPPSSKEETHTLQKRAEPTGPNKKKPWYMRSYNTITNLVCGTGQVRNQAAIDNMLRQSNAGVSQQEVIAPEGSEQEVQQPVIDLGEGDQTNVQPQNEPDSPLVGRNRAQTIIRRPNIAEMNNPGMNYDQPVLRLNADGSIPEESAVLPQGLAQSQAGSVQSGQGSGQAGTEVGDPDELRISLSESSRNPFIPGKAAREYYRDDPLWKSDELNLSDEVEADVVDVGRNVGNNQPVNGQDPMTAGVKNYLAGQKGRNVVVDEPPKKKQGFLRRLFNGIGREEAPLKVVTGPAETVPRYTGEVNVQPGWLVNPGEALAELEKYASLRRESDRLAQLGIDPETAERQYLQRQRLENQMFDAAEERRRAKIFDEIYPEGDPGEVYVASNEEPQRLLEQPNGNNNRPESMNQAQVLPNQMNTAQIQYPATGINAQLGSPSRSNVADQDDNETDYVSFGNDEFLIGEDTANFAANLKESVQSQGWNLGVSQISGFPQVEANQGPRVEYPAYIEGESRDGDDFDGLASEQIEAESRNGDDYADLVDSEIVDSQQLDAGEVNPNAVNFSFANPNLANSLQLGNSGGSQGQGSQQLSQAAQQLQ